MKKSNKDVGVLLVNLGTPSAPTPKAINAFLSEFLHDKRVVDLPRCVWYPLLHGVILPIRGHKVAKLYKKVWTPQGSPLMVYSIRQKITLEKRILLPVDVGMTYGQPSILNALHSLIAKGCKKVLVFPLYPQYSQTTTAAVFDKLAMALRQFPALPELRFINHYHKDDAYIEALALSIESQWLQSGKPNVLVCSYHGIPQRFVDNGDPYSKQCLETTDKLSLRLGEDVQIITTFQSRFGREPWLQPYTADLLKKLATDGVKRLDIITPGFSVDCLETLEEVAVECRDIFLKNGGQVFRYIPCLNDSAVHIDMMLGLIKKHTDNW